MNFYIVFLTSKSKFLKDKDSKDNIFNKNKTSNYNILFVVNEIENNDIGNNIIDFANYLTNNNVFVVIFTNNITTKIFFDKRIVFITNKKIKNHYLKQILFFFKIKKICRQYNIDIINILNQENCKKIRTIAKNIQCPTILTLYSKVNIDTKWQYYLNKEIVKNDLIVITSDELKDFILNNFTFNYSKIVKLNSCIDASYFQKNNISKERVKDLLNNIDFSIGSKKIFYCPYNITEINMLYKILQSISLIDDDNFVVLFSSNLAISSKKNKEIFQKIKELKINKKVKLINNLIDIPAMYASCYAVITLITENIFFTKTSIEAGFMRKPSLEIYDKYTTNTVINKKTGFIAKLDNVLDITKMLLKFLNLTNEEYQAMCQNAYNYATKHFDRKNIFEHLNNNISNCISVYRQNLQNKNNIKIRSFFKK